jgi:gluconolactonase
MFAIEQEPSNVRSRDVVSRDHQLGWREPFRYPDPWVQSLDPRFDQYRVFNASVERLWTGGRWCEGPVWFGDGRYLLWSDIPNDRILRWQEETRQVSEFRRPAGHANGNVRDRQGRLVTCEHLGRRLSRTEYDGTVKTLIDNWQGRRLNSPNDLVVTVDGSVWFSDPSYGIEGHYEGDLAEPELPESIYRIDGATGETTLVADDVPGANGLCFSPDERVLYVVSSRADPNPTILAYDVSACGRALSGKRLLIDAGPGGTPDGICCDVDGNLWCGWGMGTEALDGVLILAPDGTKIGRITLPERCANLCFGGRKRNRLFMAASRSLYAVYVNAQGMPGR